MIVAILQIVAIICIALGVVMFALVAPNPVEWTRRQWQWRQVRRAIKRSDVRYPVPDVTRRLRK